MGRVQLVKSVIYGGLSLRSCRKINEAASLKHCWDFYSSDTDWAQFLRARFLKHGEPSKSCIKSSIWPALKAALPLVLDNAVWNLGCGNTINFWHDHWLVDSVTAWLRIPSSLHHLFHSKVADFISNSVWNIPPTLHQHCPDLVAAIYQTHIPLVPVQDQVKWSNSDSGNISLKEAYLFLNPKGSTVSWCKLIWQACIPPSKSFLFWRLLHHKLPTDENLAARGCVTVSICSLCGSNAETSAHLFLECSFATDLWNWVRSVIDCDIYVSSISSLLSVCNRTWSSQVRDIILAIILNVVYSVWRCRNSLRFEDKCIPIRSAINSVMASVSLTGYFSKGAMSSCVQEFSILKAFVVSGHVCKAPYIKEVTWSPPACFWVKYNTDGASRGNPGWSACGGIFRDYRAAALGCFAANLGVTSSFNAELTGVMLAIEHAVLRGWKNLWLECDSELVVAVFSKPGSVP